MADIIPSKPVTRKKAERCYYCEGSSNDTPRRVIEEFESEYDGTIMTTQFLAPCRHCDGTGWES